ncbi:MAG: hypothetical protein U0441_23475 [Polyangiaceae bacterium]
MQDPNKANQDNRANQLNPNNPAFWKSRGSVGVPAQVNPGSGGQNPAQHPVKPAVQPPKK